MVVGHQMPTLRIPEQLGYVPRWRIKNSLVTNLEPPHTFTSASFVWSEYSTLFENYQDFNDAEIVGVYHYRCILNLQKIPTDCLPRFVMPFLLRRQVKVFNNLKNEIVVGKPNVSKLSLLADFESLHPKFLSALEDACNEYDKITDRSNSSYQTLATTKDFIPRNIFISKGVFAREWICLAHQIAVKLDIKYGGTFQNDERWGGYVLERLFSVFVFDYSKSNRVEIKFVPHLYLEKNSIFIKYQLLKISFVSRLHLRRKIKS